MNSLFFLRFVHFRFRFGLVLELEKVGRDEAAAPVDLGVEEAVVIERAQHANDITLLQLELFVARVNVRTRQRWIVIINCDVNVPHAVVSLLALIPKIDVSAFDIHPFDLHFLSFLSD